MGTEMETGRGSEMSREKERKKMRRAQACKMPKLAETISYNGAGVMMLFSAKQGE